MFAALPLIAGGGVDDTAPGLGATAADVTNEVVGSVCQRATDVHLIVLGIMALLAFYLVKGLFLRAMSDQQGHQTHPSAPKSVWYLTLIAFSAMTLWRDREFLVLIAC